MIPAPVAAASGLRIAPDGCFPPPMTVHGDNNATHRAGSQQEMLNFAQAEFR